MLARKKRYGQAGIAVLPWIDYLLNVGYYLGLCDFIFILFVCLVNDIT